MLGNKIIILALTILAGKLSLIIRATYNISYYKAKFHDIPPPNGTTYDYIVVGAGSSGSVVAGRLAEAGHSILLIDAGGPAHFLQVGGQLNASLISFQCTVSFRRFQYWLQIS